MAEEKKVEESIGGQAVDTTLWISKEGERLFNGVKGVYEENSEWIQKEAIRAIESGQSLAC